jgi:hypothetical protein
MSRLLSSPEYLPDVSAICAGPTSFYFPVGERRACLPRSAFVRGAVSNFACNAQFQD